ncbi:MAG: IS30 family transposase [Microgenomates group bacterium]
MKNRGKIGPSERDQIAVLLSSKTPLREIARKLGRSVSSISDEVKRNSINGVYTAISAQAKSEGRNRRSRKTNPLKNPALYSYIYDKLRHGWSPEEIAGRLRRRNKGKTVICHETIYRYVHSKEGKKKGLYEYLVRQHKERRHWYGRHQYQRGIPDRTSLDLRPKVINQRGRFGDWEVDCVEGKGHKKGIHTFLERKTRFYQGVLLENIDSEFGVKAQLETFKALPPKARRSATFDNGRENFNHTRLKIFLGMKTYFCDPNAAWQKGANEHFNGVLRRYIPKKTDLTTITQFELDSITEEMNNRPLKCLKYETPSEAFARELKSITN